MWPIEERHLSAHDQLYSLQGNTFSNVTVTASDNLFEDQMINSAIAHTNLLLSNNDAKRGAINLCLSAQ